jgi:hypothetical protein
VTGLPVLLWYGDEKPDRLWVHCVHLDIERLFTLGDSLDHLLRVRYQSLGYHHSIDVETFVFPSCLPGCGGCDVAWCDTPHNDIYSVLVLLGFWSPS